MRYYNTMANRVIIVQYVNTNKSIVRQLAFFFILILSCNKYSFILLSYYIDNLEPLPSHYNFYLK
jgi:hypothetical protein